MPTYEYRCDFCEHEYAVPRKIEDRDKPYYCTTGSRSVTRGGQGNIGCIRPCERIISLPATQVWKKDRKFPNTSSYGDGTRQFDTKADYNLYKIENHCDELSTDAPKINRLGHKTIYRF